MSSFVQVVISQDELKLLGSVEKWITLITSSFERPDEWSNWRSGKTKYRCRQGRRLAERHPGDNRGGQSIQARQLVFQLYYRMFPWMSVQVMAALRDQPRGRTCPALVRPLEIDNNFPVSFCHFQCSWVNELRSSYWCACICLKIKNTCQGCPLGHNLVLAIVSIIQLPEGKARFLE